MPEGTITFLFTDIEGSTRLWEEHPESMRLDLARHDSILRAAIETNNGHVFTTLGDAFCTAFATASDGVDAALLAQRTLQESHSLASGQSGMITLRVRIALHTGTAETRGGDYFGPTLNRVARLLASAHGGQVLLSKTTAALVQESLPRGVSLLDLGQHRLRDLIRPEQVFQLIAPDLPAEFPPLKSLTNHPSNLPVQSTSLIDRKKEIETLRVLLNRPDVRLITLTGPGGSGKTRLALQGGSETMEDFPDGIFFVSLAALRDPHLAPVAIAHTMGIIEEIGTPITQSLQDYLQGQKILLILDNFEQILGAAPQVAQLLLVCPFLKIMITSRVLLRIRGEKEFPVPPLALPNAGDRMTVEGFGQFPAVELFIQRARDAKPDFALTPENAAAIAEICARLDGLPLAIELAAARCRLLSPQAIQERLGSRLKLLVGGARDLPERHQTLRAAMDWSYHLLGEEQKLLFRRLSVFVGGWSLESAEAICVGQVQPGRSNSGQDSEVEVLDGISALSDSSLIRCTETEEGEPRFEMLETIREFAMERLAESQEMESLQALHAGWFADWIERVEPYLRGIHQRAWLEQIDREHDNLRASLEWCQQSGATETSLRIAGALARYWSVRGFLSEGRRRLAAALELAAGDTGSPAARAQALSGAGTLAERQGDYASAEELYEQSLRIRREIGDQKGIATSVHGLANLCLQQGSYARAQSLYEESLKIRTAIGENWGIAASQSSLGHLAYLHGQFDTARSLYQQSLEIRRGLGDKQGIASSLGSLGLVVCELGDFHTSRVLHEESLGIWRELGDRQGIATSLNNLGTVAREQGEYQSALTLHQESLEILQEMEDRWGAAISLDNLGLVARQQGDLEEAHHYYHQSLSLRQDLGDLPGITTSLELLAGAATAMGHLEEAAQLFAAADSLRGSLGVPLLQGDRAAHDGDIAAIRERLGESAFSAAWSQGNAMSLEQALELSLKH